MSNVMVSKYSDFKDKKFLVVDDFPEFRTAIKRMVEAFGATDIDTASNGDAAIAQILANKYDAILCDYNLGDGKDGQQVLEEAKYRRAINESQIFILLTAENTAEMVMGALEYEPDSYLVKPFNKEMVHNRLMKAVLKKRELKDIYAALDKKEYEKAIKLCDEHIAQGKRSALSALKLKGKILLEEKNYEEAEKIYLQLSENKKSPWVLMGLGKIYFLQEKYKDALKCFEGIIEISEVNVEGYDWIAKTKIAMGEKQEAQNILERAISLSSKAILRQQLLGDLAYENGDNEVAEKAYKEAVNLGRHSCYIRNQDYLRYAELLIKKSISDEQGRITLKAGNEAVQILEMMLTLFKDEREIVIFGNILLVHALCLASRKDKAKLVAKKTKEIIEKYKIELPVEQMVKLGEGYVLAGENEVGEELIAKYKKA